MNAEIKTNLDRQHRFFSRVSETYDKKSNRENSNHFYKIEQIEAVFLKELISKNKTKKFNFMEIGAGTGIHARHFLSTFKDNISAFTASDLSGEMLEKAKARLRSFTDKVTYEISAAEAIPAGRKFDGIYISSSLHHFASLPRALKNIRELLNPDGVLVICEPVVWNPVNLIKALLSEEDRGQFSFARRGEVRRCLEKYGFTIILDRTLHFRGASSLLRKVWPYEKLEKFKPLDPLAIMFLLAAKPDSSVSFPS